MHEHSRRLQFCTLPWFLSLAQIPKSGILRQGVCVSSRLSPHTPTLAAWKPCRSLLPLSGGSCRHWLPWLLEVSANLLGKEFCFCFDSHFLNAVGKHIFTCCLTAWLPVFLDRLFIIFILHFPNAAFFLSLLIRKTSYTQAHSPHHVRRHYFSQFTVCLSSCLQCFWHAHVYSLLGPSHQSFPS